MLSWRLNTTINFIWYQRNGISGIKLKTAYFSQGHCHQRKSRSSCQSFVAMVSGLCPSTPHQGLGIFTFPYKHKRKQPKSSGAAGERLLGCDSTKLWAVSRPSLVPRQSALFKQKAFWLESGLRVLPQKPRGVQGTQQYGCSFLEEATAWRCGLEVMLGCK